MKRYLVGGAVRDRLLGLPVVDRDWVLVGADVDALVAQGYQPVGADFPVFLHPETHEEHALARSERKTAPGYRGFAFHAGPEVTLEEDLMRRDLTINAMAEDESGALVDPFNGKADLERRIFRHVSPAFAEDPVRILRVARFAARHPEFVVAPETSALMRQMVDAGEADALVPERVWREVSRGLMETKPSRMLEVLRDCGALARVLPRSIACSACPSAPTTTPRSTPACTC
jgi:tRNA nucleotidyltransferase (CCA-adding enzyme)